MVYKEEIYVRMPTDPSALFHAGSQTVPHLLGIYEDYEKSLPPPLRAQRALPLCWYATCDPRTGGLLCSTLCSGVVRALVRRRGTLATPEQCSRILTRSDRSRDDSLVVWVEQHLGSAASAAVVQAFPACPDPPPPAPSSSSKSSSSSSSKRRRVACAGDDSDEIPPNRYVGSPPELQNGMPPEADLFPPSPSPPAAAAARTTSSSSSSARLRM